MMIRKKSLEGAIKEVSHTAKTMYTDTDILEREGSGLVLLLSAMELGTWIRWAGIQAIIVQNLPR